MICDQESNAPHWGLEALGPNSSGRQRYRSPVSGIVLVEIPPGAFLMGSEEGDADEKPVHKVELTKPFLMGETPVTQEQYRAVTNATPSYFRGEALPVERVGWYGALRFGVKLTELERKSGLLSERCEFRLPTEAEWEYCCRAGAKTEYNFGEDEALLGIHAWFSSNSGNKTHLVGTRNPNAWGLYDMHGNVWEWCQDAYDEAFYAKCLDAVDPVNNADCALRVTRGGSWCHNSRHCRSACRRWCSPDDPYNRVGFRVVLSPVIP
ncbi:MAG: formylglycine-generating enzyme family protein [Candidatus Brocadiia bacterium]